MMGIVSFNIFVKNEQKQLELISRKPLIKKDLAHFDEAMKNIKTVDDLVKDKSLLRVAMTAMGLESELYKTAFIKKVLNDGTLDPAAFANKLVDKRWKAFADVFNMADKGADFELTEAQLADIRQRFLEKKQEVELDNQNPNLRLAINFKREIERLSATTGSENTKLYTILGQVPLKTVLQDAFNLPDSVAKMSIEKQKDLLVDKMKKIGINSIKELAEPDNMNKFIKLYMTRADIKNSGYLGGMNGSAAGIFTLLSNSTNKTGLF